MAGCPYRNFEDCPQHNKKGGCELWMSYSGKGGVTDANMEGCDLVLTPMLLLENANALGLVAGEVNKVGAEVSAGRVENLRECEATRRQLIGLAYGDPALIQPEHTAAIQPVEASHA